MQTVYEMVRLAAARTPAHAAIVASDDSRLTYAELVAEVEAVAAGLADSGIGTGDIVAAVVPNRRESCVALLALARLGAVPALMNPRLKAGEISALVAGGQMRGAIALPTPGMIEALRGALPPRAPVIAIGGAPSGTIDLADCRGSAARLAPYATPDPEAAAFVFYTSGTTGLPKGVVLPARVADARVLFNATQGGLTHGRHNRAFGVMPLFHVVGFFSVFLTTLAFNGTYFVCSAFEPGAALAAIERNAITYLFATPTHLHALLNAPGFAPARVASVETLMYAGAAMPLPLLDLVDKAFHARIVNIYGTTEVMNAAYMPDPALRPNVVRPGFYSNLRVVRIGGGVGDVVPPGIEGELLVDASADATFSGYLHRPDATAEKLQDGWYRTGDVTVVLSDGDLELRGRVDDMIITGAENVHPDEIEAVLRGHPAVRDVAVIGVPDARWGERIVACVVAAAPPALDAAELDRHCQASSLANFKRPRGYVFVGAIPRNAANKVLRRDLRAEAAARLGKHPA
jgi:acyl-CoA synthetase (AMP-forming)/AMP-acid ligase II